MTEGNKLHVSAEIILEVTSLEKGNEVEQGHMLNDFASLP